MRVRSGSLPAYTQIIDIRFPERLRNRCGRPSGTKAVSHPAKVYWRPATWHTASPLTIVIDSSYRCTWHGEPLQARIRHTLHKSQLNRNARKTDRKIASRPPE